MWFYCHGFTKRLLASSFPIFILIITMSGCGSYGESDPSDKDGSNNKNFNNTINPYGDFFRSSSSGVAPKLNDTEISRASKLYKDQCVECHGLNGHGGITGISLRHCPSCKDHESLSSSILHTMPTENPSTCGKECSDLLASYIGLKFPRNAASIFTFQPSNDFSWLAGEQSIIEKMDATGTLHKASRNLASRPPTDGELELISRLGERGLNQALETIVNDQNFCSERLMEIYNDRLRTDDNIDTRNFIRLYHKEDFPNLFWFRNAGNNRLVKQLSQFTIDAIARQPLHLIAYVACNDRPFTEILTADYMVVNPFSAEALGIQGINFKNANDPKEFQPTQLIMNNRAIPHAGILTTPSFLRRYPTTKSNLNRGRAYRVYLNFLATDILNFNGFRPTIDSAQIEHPEVNDPNCNQCHKTLDPVAQLFFNWDSGFGFGIPYLYKDANSAIHKDRPNMWPAGFETRLVPDAEAPNAIAWLAKQITQDRRFARSVVMILNEGFTGEQSFSQPSDTLTDPYAGNAYDLQQRFFDAMTDLFIENNFDIKTLSKALIINNPYFRAQSIKNLSLQPGYSIEDQNIPPSLQVLGVSRLLDPSMLSRKINNTFWFTWSKEPSEFDTTFRKPPLENEIGLLYGKLDNESNRQRVLEPNGIMAAIQTQMATEVGLFSAMQDFSLPQAQRKLFPKLDTHIVPLDEAGNRIENNISLIRDTIRHLHHHIYGSIDSDEVEHTLELFISVWLQGSQMIGADQKKQFLPKPLKTNPLTKLPFDSNFIKDEHYTIRSWGSVISYLVNDYKFLYE